MGPGVHWLSEQHSTEVKQSSCPLSTSKVFVDLRRRFSASIASSEQDSGRRHRYYLMNINTYIPGCLIWILRNAMVVCQASAANTLCLLHLPAQASASMSIFTSGSKARVRSARLGAAPVANLYWSRRRADEDLQGAWTAYIANVDTKFRLT